MAYDQHTADRIQRYLEERKLNFYTKKMFGGLCFMIDDKMALGVLFNKKAHAHVLMARIGAEETQRALEKEGCLPMDFTGRPMKDYVFVRPEGYDLEVDMEYYVEAALRFNPLAKASKKRR